MCSSILIVDDDDGIRESIRDVLEIEGFNVHTARNGREALSKLEKLEQPCLILLDLMMPIMSGWEFLEARKGQSKIAQIPVVVSTAAGSGVQTLGDGLLRKPVDLEALFSFVSRYCKALKHVDSPPKAA